MVDNGVLACCAVLLFGSFGLAFVYQYQKAPEPGTSASVIVNTVEHDGHFAPSPQRPQDSPEEGKPASCDNYHSTAPAHRCACGKALHDKCSQPDPDVEMDRRCKTYCRKQNCKCMSACTT
jgi:hypothetical protein